MKTCVLFAVGLLVTVLITFDIRHPTHKNMTVKVVKGSVINKMLAINLQRGENICDRCGHEFDQQPLFQQHIDSDHLNGDSIISSSLLNNDDRANCLNQEEVSFANVP